MSAKTKKLSITLAILGVLIVIGIALGFIFQNNIKTIASDISTTIENQGKPEFIFDTSSAPGWWSAGNIWLNPDDIVDDGYGNKDDLSIADISAHQCKVLNRCSDPEKDLIGGRCFVMALYKDRIVNPDAAVEEVIRQNESFGTTSITETGTKVLTMNTPEGSKEYTLHYYDYEGRGGDTIQRGNALGFVPLGNGHIEVRSVCAEVNQLDETIPALQAISLRARS